MSHHKSTSARLSPKKVRPAQTQALDVLIDAYVVDENEQQNDISFRASAVDSICGYKDNLSVITLRSGLQIPVRVKKDVLRRRIFTPDPLDGGVLNLKAYSGFPAHHTAKDANLPEQFTNASCLPPETGGKQTDDLYITAFLRPTRQSGLSVYHFKQHRFPLSALDMNKVEENASAVNKNKKMTVLFFKTANDRPFKTTSLAAIEMDLKSFVEAVNVAQMKNKKDLDLMDKTRLKVKKESSRTLSF